MKRVCLIIFILLLINYTNALSASIQPPRMVLRVELPGNVNSSLNVMNPNNMTILINITPTGSLANFIELSDRNFTLGYNETKKVDFNIRLKSPGNYTGELVVRFMPEEGQGLALASQIVVLATGTEEEPANTLFVAMLVNNASILSIVILIVIVIAVLLVKRRH